MATQKNTVICYLLWLFGGFLGLHHVYLRRNRHALLWYCTMGGFGVGWLREICRLPSYVQDANNHPDFIQELKDRIRSHPKPPFNIERFVAQFVVGTIFGFLVRACIPEDIYESSFMYKLINLCVPYAVALGVYLVANIGRQESSLRSSLIGSYMLSPVLIMSSQSITYLALSSALYTHARGVHWRRSRRSYSYGVRITGFLLCCSIYSSLWVITLRHNAYVTTQFGEKVLLKDAAENFFNSEVWEDTKETGARLWGIYLDEGIGRLWQEFVVAMDPEGETHAYKVLGLSTSADEDAIRQAYRILVKEWHPDKHKDEKMKTVAEERFMEIQSAYDKISTIQAKRAEKHLKTPKRETPGGG